jgi:hypothetical protein
MCAHNHGVSHKKVKKVEQLSALFLQLLFFGVKGLLLL